MRKFVSLFAVALLAVAFAAEAQVDDRRWIVQTSDGKLIGFTDDQDVDPPDAAFATFVLESVIRAADPPGATGEILPLGTWIAGVYTAPSGGGIVEHIDPTTDQGSVQEACSDMMDVFEIALSFIQDNRHVWTHEGVKRATDGIHWQTVNSARVALNSTRTAATRAKFCEESASWPTGVNGDVGDYVDGMQEASQITGDLSKDWSWVGFADNVRAAISGSIGHFSGATNVEDAPSTADLIGRGWINDIP